MNEAETRAELIDPKLADQAFNAFSAFPEDALVRINPKEIGRKGGVPVNGSIFFTIFQTFMSGPDGKPVSAEEFLQNMFGVLPEFFKSEEELRKIWSSPITRKALLEKLDEAGYGKDVLATLQKLIDAEKSDLFDVLEYVSFAVKPITREPRVAKAQSKIFAPLNGKQKEFLEFVLSKYIETGVEELDQEKLPGLLTLKYHRHFSLGDEAAVKFFAFLPIRTLGQYRPTGGMSEDQRTRQHGDAADDGYARQQAERRQQQGAERPQFQ